MCDIVGVNVLNTQDQLPREKFDLVFVYIGSACIAVAEQITARGEFKDDVGFPHSARDGGTVFVFHHVAGGNMVLD